MFWFCEQLNDEDLFYSDFGTQTQRNDFLNILARNLLAYQSKGIWEYYMEHAFIAEKKGTQIETHFNLSFNNLFNCLDFQYFNLQQNRLKNTKFLAKKIPRKILWTSLKT